LYPPLGELNKELAVERLTNGTDVTGPLNGYQFIWIHGESDQEPDTIWIKGDDECPAFTAASKGYRKSEEYLATLDSSRDFYSQFVKPLDGILPAANVSYAQAFDVFDLLNVGRIHNESVAAAVTESQLDQLRYYADSSELALNYNKTVPARSIGGMTLAGGILRQLDQTVTTQGKLKLSLMAGSFDTMLSFFGLTNLTDLDPNFKGLPTYASNLAFELFTDANVDTFPTDPADLRVRFLFRNGTTTLKTFPLFGRSEDTLSYADFKTELGARAISTVKDWCSMCQSAADFCSLDQYASSSSSGATASAADGGSKSGKSGLTVAQAGVVGAITTLGAVALLAALAFFLRRRKTKSADSPVPGTEKLDHGSDMGSQGCA
jgi:prostatic aicd phosphatase